MDGHTQIPIYYLNSGFIKKKDDNKKLFSFLGEQIAHKNLDGKLFLGTKFDSVLSNRPCNVLTLQPCNNPQDQAWIFLRLAHAPGHGHHTA